MFKSARDRARKIAGNRLLLLMRISFLLTFGLWFWGFYAHTDGLGDMIVDGIVAVILAALTFEWVALGLALLLIPVRVLVSIFRNSDG